MIIIGITGTLGAGKGTIVDYLIGRGFRHYSVRSFITEEILQRKLPVNRDSMVVVANDLRRIYGPAYMAEALYKRAVQSGENCIIESIRTPGEIDSLRKLGEFYLFAVDADPVLRYQRVKVRASETDHISYDTFLANEIREMDAIDPNHQNLRRCIEQADFVFLNEGTIEALQLKVKAVLDNIINKSKNDE